MAYDSNRSIAIILRTKRPLLAVTRHRSALSRQKATAACRMGPPMIRYEYRIEGTARFEHAQIGIEDEKRFGDRIDDRLRKQIGLFEGSAPEVSLALRSVRHKDVEIVECHPRPSCCRRRRDRPPVTGRLQMRSGDTCAYHSIAALPMRAWWRCRQQETRCRSAERMFASRCAVLWRAAMQANRGLPAVNPEAIRFP